MTISYYIHAKQLQRQQLTIGAFSLIPAESIQPFEYAVINPSTAKITSSPFTNSSSEVQSTTNAEKFFSHPLLILILGAIITGLLFPFFTNRWQSRQKDLELQLQLKLDLIKQINESIIQTVMTSLFAWRPLTSDDEITTVYRKWEISSSEIESDMEAYFPNTEIRKIWHDYSEVLKDFYTLSLDLAKKDRISPEVKAKLTKLRNYFPTNENIDWHGLEEMESDLQLRYDKFVEFGREVMGKKGIIIRKILELQMPTIQRHSFSFMHSKSE